MNDMAKPKDGDLVLLLLPDGDYEVALGWEMSDHPHVILVSEEKLVEAAEKLNQCVEKTKVDQKEKLTEILGNEDCYLQLASRGSYVDEPEGRYHTIYVEEVEGFRFTTEERIVTRTPDGRTFAWYWEPYNSGGGAHVGPTRHGKVEITEVEQKQVTTHVWAEKEEETSPIPEQPKSLYSTEDYENAPVGTVVKNIVSGEHSFVWEKVEEGRWRSTKGVALPSREVSGWRREVVWEPEDQNISRDGSMSYNQILDPYEINSALDGTILRESSGASQTPFIKYGGRWYRAGSKDPILDFAMFTSEAYDVLWEPEA